MSGRVLLHLDLSCFGPNLIVLKSNLINNCGAAAQGTHLSSSGAASSQGGGTVGTWMGCAGGLARAGSGSKAPMFAEASPPWSILLASACEPPGE